jgi:hypothetical protein
MKKVLVVAVALIFVLSALALAGLNPAPKTAIHVRAHSAKAGCTITPAIEGCEDIVTTLPAPTYSIDAFTIHFNLVEYLGTSYGVCWPPEWGSAGWNSCSPLTVGAVYYSGDGAAHTWTECDSIPPVVAVSSYLWLYAYTPGMICPCPHPTSGVNEVLDCHAGKDIPVCYFCAGVQGMIGDDPCDPTGTEQSTWGGIKAMFE